MSTEERKNSLKKNETFNVSKENIDKFSMSSGT
jgi:hypothetical protein